MNKIPGKETEFWLKSQPVRFYQGLIYKTITTQLKLFSRHTLSGANSVQVSYSDSAIF